MSEHAKHFVPGGTGQLVPVPEFGCPDCAAGLGPVIDWPARFHAAADAAETVRAVGPAHDLYGFAIQLEQLPSHVVEAIGRALLGEES